MTPEAQRIAIAEACGWKRRESVCVYFKYVWMREGKHTYALPDYLNDLNAMHEAEKTLSYCEQMNFIDALLAIIKNEPDYDIDDDFCSDDGWSLVSATASERAEAFLRAVGRWTE